MHPRSHRCAPLLSLLLLASTACSEGGDAGGAPPAASPTPSPTSAGPCRLTYGWDPLEPYEYRNADGEVEGLDVDIVHAALGAVRCEVRLEEGRWSTLMRRLQRGDVDVVAGAARTAARDSFALFTQPYRMETSALFVRKGDVTVQRSASLQALLDTGFRLGVKEQYSYGETVDALQEDPRYTDRFVGATTSAQSYQRLLDLEIDGLLEDPVSARVVMRREGLQEEIEPHPLPIYSGEVGLMFSRASVDPAVVALVDEALARMKAEGQVQEIVARYTN
jgi:polar amino acid transport system substrate-binding protein